MASEICSIQDAKLRRALIEKFIEMAKLAKYHHPLLMPIRTHFIFPSSSTHARSTVTSTRTSTLYHLSGLWLVSDCSQMVEEKLGDNKLQQIMSPTTNHDFIYTVHNIVLVCSTYCVLLSALQRYMWRQDSRH